MKCKIDTLNVIDLLHVCQGLNRLVLSFRTSLLYRILLIAY